MISIQTISTQQNIPKRFLEQILNDLKVFGFVQSRRGTTGGYRLAFPPDRIALASVVRQLEGSAAPAGCVNDGQGRQCSCPDPIRCPLKTVMQEVRDAVSLVLEKTTLADLVARAEELRKLKPHEPDFVI